MTAMRLIVLYNYSDKNEKIFVEPIITHNIILSSFIIIATICMFLYICFPITAIFIFITIIFIFNIPLLSTHL